MRKCTKCGEYHYRGVILSKGEYVCWKCVESSDLEEALRGNILWIDKLQPT